MNVASIAGCCLVIGVTLGCGRSLSSEDEGEGGAAAAQGGGDAESGGSSASGGRSAEGGSATGGTAQGGSTAGDGAQGGSATGGSAHGGSSGAGASGASHGGNPPAGSGGAAGEGGDSTTPTRLLLQVEDSLVAADPEKVETVELCPGAGAQVSYQLVDWVNERAIVFRRSFMPSAGELLRVALDGSECTSLFQNESVLEAYSPVVAGHVALAINPLSPSALGAQNGGDGAISIPLGLATFALDGSALAVLAGTGVSDVRIVGEHVVFLGPGDAGGYDFFSALPDGSSVVAPVPDEGSEAIVAVQGRRVVVNTLTSSDVYAVDADGQNLTPLAVGSELDFGGGFLENRVIIHRSVPAGDVSQYDILSVDSNGGELVPLATSSDGELFRGQVGDRIVYERATDIYTARLDGSDALPVVQSPEVNDIFVASAGNRIVFGHGEFVEYFSVSPDGSDLVTLHDSSMGLTAIAGDRAVFYVGSPNYDLVSVPLVGGEPLLLAGGPEPDWHVGTLGTALVVQRAATQVEAGTILLVEADGSREVTLAPSARYVGAVTQACGALREYNAAPNDCAP